VVAGSNPLTIVVFRIDGFFLKTVTRQTSSPDFLSDSYKSRISYE